MYRLGIHKLPRRSNYFPAKFKVPGPIQYKIQSQPSYIPLFLMIPLLLRLSRQHQRMFTISISSSVVGVYIPDADVPNSYIRRNSMVYISRRAVTDKSAGRTPAEGGVSIYSRKMESRRRIKGIKRKSRPCSAEERSR